MNKYSKAVQDLQSRKTGKDDITIQTVKKVLEELDNPENDYSVILVGGTNGKGSTVEMISTMLQDQNKDVGTSKSPHLTSVRERIQINNQKVSREEFLALYNELEKLDQELSFFESIIAMSYLYFSKKNVDYAVMEVGMGGRLDATNAAEPELSVITNVGLDHTEYLGDSKEEIAAEKAGIIPQNGKIVTGESFNQIKETAGSRNSEKISPVKVQKLDDRKYQFQDQKFSVPVRGSFQKQNLQNSITAVRELEEVPEDLGEALSNLKCPGRMEKISQNPEIILDGAHNPPALEKLMSDMPEEFICVFNSIETKKYSNMIEILEGKASKFIFTESNIEWSADPLEIQKKCKTDSEIIREPVEAVREAARHGKPVIVTGSLYLIGELKQKDLNIQPKLQTKEL